MERGPVVFVKRGVRRRGAKVKGKFVFFQEARLEPGAGAAQKIYS